MNVSKVAVIVEPPMRSQSIISGSEKEKAAT